MILVLAFPNTRVLAIVAKSKTDAVYNFWNKQKTKPWLKTLSWNPITKHQIDTYMRFQHRISTTQKCLSLELSWQTGKVILAWNANGSFCRWISHISADEGKQGLCIMSLSSVLWWGVSVKIFFVHHTPPCLLCLFPHVVVSRELQCAALSLLKRTRGEKWWKEMILCVELWTGRTLTNYPVTITSKTDSA